LGSKRDTKRKRKEKEEKTLLGERIACQIIAGI
jgi:hypothetical protein